MRPASPLAILPLLALALLAGCADDEPRSSDSVTELGGTKDPFAAARALVAGVPCEAEVGDGTSENLLQLAHATFEAGVSQEIDIRGDLLLSADFSGLGTIDISDPLAPRPLAELRDLGGGQDVKFSPDNQTALVGTGSGVVLVDIRDPAAPVVEGEWAFADVDIVQDPINKALTENAHMLYTARIAEADWVFVAPNTNSGVWILRLVGEPGARSLEYVAQTLPIQGGPLGPHDMWVTQDETEGWLLYSADGYHGWNVFNVDDPANPQLVGGLNRPETGYTHTIQAGMVEGRRIVVTIQEVGVNIMEVYDASNLMAPVLLANWQFEPGYTGPQHNFQIVNGTLYLAHYNLGLFVFDLRDAGTMPLLGTATLTPVARYGDGGAADGLLFGGFWDVVVDHGLVYGSSMSGDTVGVHVIGFGCNAVGDVALTSSG